MSDRASVEILPRPDLARLQVERLRTLVTRAARVPLHRDRLAAARVGPDDVRTLDDLRRLPFTTKTDFRDTYPFGLLAAPMDEIVRIHASSGTTGKPTVVVTRAGTWRSGPRSWADAPRGGVRRGDVVQNAYGYGLFTGGLGFHYGAEALGAAVIPVSGGFTERQLVSLRDLGSTVLCCTPSYALHLAEAIEEAGLSIGGLRLRVGFFGAEPWTEAMRDAIEDRLHLMALNIYGLSEVTGPGVAVECPERQGMHVAEDHFLPEVVDPDTLQPVPPGTTGELVLTTLSKQGMPLLRYRTRDLTTLDPDSVPLRADIGAHRSHHGTVRRHAHHPGGQRLSLADRARHPPGAGARAALPPGGPSGAPLDTLEVQRGRAAGRDDGRGSGPQRRSPPASVVGSSRLSASRPRSASWRRRRSSAAPARPSASSIFGHKGHEVRRRSPGWRVRFVNRRRSSGFAGSSQSSART